MPNKIMDGSIAFCCFLNPVWAETHFYLTKVKGISFKQMLAAFCKIKVSAVEAGKAIEMVMTDTFDLALNDLVHQWSSVWRIGGDPVSKDHVFKGIWFAKRIFVTSLFERVDNSAALRSAYIHDYLLFRDWKTLQ